MKVQEVAKEIKPEKGTLKLSKEELKKKIQRQREKDRQKVKGVFRFYEMPGGVLSFSYRAYKEDEIENFELVDGQMYEIPLGVAKHLNNNGWYPEYEYIKGEKFVGGYGVSGGMRIAKKKHRYGFSGLDFVDLDEDLPEKKIVAVTEL
jgi:hypothetical protein